MSFLYFDKPLHKLSFCRDAVRVALCFVCGISCMIQTRSCSVKNKMIMKKASNVIESCKRQGHESDDLHVV